MARLGPRIDEELTCTPGSWDYARWGALVHHVSTPLQSARRGSCFACVLEVLEGTGGSHKAS